LAVSSRFRDQDIIGIHESGIHLALAVLFIRGGRIVGSRAFMFKDREDSKPAVLRAFISQYYEKGRAVPEEILIGETVLEQQLLEEWLTDIRGKRVSIRVPRRGEGRQLLTMASHNAANYLLTHVPKATDPLPALQRLQKKLALKSFPHVLECVDISNFRGQFPVGSIIVFKDGEPDKSSYRRYRIKDVSQIDDVAMMAEVLRRRFSSTKESPTLPDLLVVDGGKAQLNQAVEVLEEMDLVTPVQVVALAKRQKLPGKDQLRASDRLYLKGRKNPLVLVNDPPVHFLLSRLRDEAHRFAISYYQKRHRTSSLRSALDEIRGIGPKRRRDLIGQFGSVNRLAKASVEEISQVPGISTKLAEEIVLGLQKK
jgi:excinuclease ABC subunit C